VTATIIAAGTPSIAEDLRVSKAKATYVLTTPVVGKVLVEFKGLESIN
jgi:hypothetical protein